MYTYNLFTYQDKQNVQCTVFYLKISLEIMCSYKDIAENNIFRNSGLNKPIHH